MSKNSLARYAVGATLVAIAAGAPAAAQAAGDAAVAAAVQSGADWVQTQQNPDGTFDPGFSSFDPTAPALAAAGRNAADISRSGSPSLQDALFRAMSDPSNPQHPNDVGAYQNAILSAHAAGIDPARVSASQNLAADLASTYAGGYFGDPSLFNNAVYGALALNRLSGPSFLVARSAAVIRQNQHYDGGWNFDRSTTAADKASASDVDLTGAALAALCESGASASDPAVADAVDYLRQRFDPSTGGFLSFGSSNTNTNAAAVSGLKTCGIDPQGPYFNADQTPIDYLLARQNNSGGPTDGSFEYSGSPNPAVPAGPDLAASRDAVRALVAGGFSANPPGRPNPALPRRRPVPAVPDGTSVPIALAVDNGAGGVTFCRVTTRSGASLAALLAAANRSSTPADCALGSEFTAGQLSKLNGRTGTWRLGVNGGGQQVAGRQAVRFGDIVALRRTGGAVPSGTTPARVASRSLKISRRKRVITVAVRCAKASRLCQGSVYLKYRRRTLARRRFLIRGGKTTKLSVKLAKRAVRRLGRKQRIKVNLFSRDGAGIGSTSTRTVTLRTRR